MSAYFFGGGGQTYNEEIHGGLIEGHDIGIVSDFVGQLEIYGTDFEQNKVDAWTIDRFGGGADGNMMFSGVTSESAQNFIFDAGGGGNFIIEASRIADQPGPNGFVMQLDRPPQLPAHGSAAAEPPLAESATAMAEVPESRFQSFRCRTASATRVPFATAPAATRRTACFHRVRRYPGEHRRSGSSRLPEPCAEHRSMFERRNGFRQRDAGLRRQLMPENFTATTGLTYTLSTTGLVADQVVTIESYIAGAIGRRPRMSQHQAAQSNGPAARRQHQALQAAQWTCCASSGTAQTGSSSAAVSATIDQRQLRRSMIRSDSARTFYQEHIAGPDRIR